MKLSRNSIGIKLWRYFVLFALVTLVLLWLLQTVFLQTFYNQMQLKSIEKAADEITEKITDSNNFNFIDRIAYENSMQIILTDTNGNIVYRVDEYSSAYQTNQNPYREDDRQNWQMGMYRNVPEDYPQFLQRLFESDNGNVSYELSSGTNSVNLIYGEIILCSDETLVLYINTPIGAVQSTVKILRTMLLAVTGLLLLIGFVLAWFFARRFAKPVSAISAQAKEIARGKENIRFEKGFCNELDELSDTLDETAESLVKLEHFRRELLANITHDLRTPLTLISGYAEKIEDLSWEEREEARLDAGIIKRESKRLTLLVNDILDYSVLQSGSVSFDFQPVNISELAEKVLIQFHVIFEQQNLICEQCIEPGLSVMADEQRISQVLYNLVINAITHVGNDKVIGLRVYQREKNARIEIYDHGKGIAQTDIPHIWERYFTSRERKRSENGTGLGLSIVKEILNAHGVQYGVISEVGQGSCFWFELFYSK